jgi:hypothetical protein
MSKQILTSVIKVASNHLTVSRSELIEAKTSASFVFGCVASNKAVDMAFVDAAYYALALIRLCVNGASANDIEEKRKDVLTITNSLRYKLCGDDGIMQTKN